MLEIGSNGYNVDRIQACQVSSVDRTREERGERREERGEKREERGERREERGERRE
jgi:division protein 1